MTNGPPTQSPLTVGLLPWGDRFETYHEKIGVSLETFRDELSGGWLFNYVDALRSVGIRTVLLFGSDRVSRPVRFTHRGTGASVSVLPTPRLYLKARNAHHRFLPRSETLAAVASYLATPFLAVARELRRQRCDVILCQEYEYPRFDVAVLLGRLLGLPVFATYQGGNKTSSWIERPLRWLTVRHCAGLIIAAGDEVARVRRTYGTPTAMLADIPNPVDVETWRPEERNDARAELGISQDAGVVVWHGRMQIHTKGLDVLLDAWELVCSTRPDATVLLLLVGSGRNAAALRRRIASNGNIKWVDRFLHDRAELRRHLSAADIYTLPSRHEGFAVAPLEAMACGLPLVVTDVSGVTDLLPGGEADGGIVIPPDDQQALAGALLRLLDEPALRRSLGARARRRVEEHFSLHVVGSRLRRFLFPDR